jgi:hypothetical protein
MPISDHSDQALRSKHALNRAQCSLKIFSSRSLTNCCCSSRCEYRPSLLTDQHSIIWRSRVRISARRHSISTEVFMIYFSHTSYRRIPLPRPFPPSRTFYYSMRYNPRRWITSLNKLAVYKAFNLCGWQRINEEMQGDRSVLLASLNWQQSCSAFPRIIAHKLGKRWLWQPREGKWLQSAS